MIDKKILDMKAAKKRRRKKQKIDRSSSFMNSAIVPEDTDLPKQDEELINEKSHDGNLILDWSFNQQGITVDRNRKRITWNLTKIEHHVCNQMEMPKNINNPKERIKSKQLWDVLLDVQSTCDVIINDALVTNIRPCEWTLRLETQLGNCCIE